METDDDDLLALDVELAEAEARVEHLVRSVGEAHGWFVERTKTSWQITASNGARVSVWFDALIHKLRVGRTTRRARPWLRRTAIALGWLTYVLSQATLDRSASVSVLPILCLVFGGGVYLATRFVEYPRPRRVPEIVDALQAVIAHTAHVRLEAPSGFRDGGASRAPEDVVHALLPGAGWKVREAGESVVAEAMRAGRKLRVVLRADAQACWLAEVSAPDASSAPDDEVRAQITHLAAEMRRRSLG